MPVYDEAATIRGMVEEIIDAIEGKFLYEIIIVESNSIDGTREIVKDLEQIRNISAIYQDAPKGKGNAVRQGLPFAKNDIIIIFDGDREYSAYDVPKLVEPISAGIANFVLGSRYKVGEPMRSFGKNRIRSRLLNSVHHVFATMCNLIYGVNLRDPFTMYKVFSRSSIAGLKFVENGFAFDVELVAKLIRNGSKPLEIPVSYKSRGFAEGKKIRFFRDGYALPIALIFHKFSKLKST